MQDARDAYIHADDNEEEQEQEQAPVRRVRRVAPPAKQVKREAEPVKQEPAHVSDHDDDFDDVDFEPPEPMQGDKQTFMYVVSNRVFVWNRRRA